MPVHQHQSKEEQRLLIVSAHPDDETFGCGGTIALEAKRGTHVLVYCLSGTKERHAELKAAAEILGAEVIADEGEDFSLTKREVATRLIPVIREHQPEVIICHSKVDYHPSHQVVHAGVLWAAEWAGHATLDSKRSWRPNRLLAMEINNLLPMPTLFIDISEVIDLKRRAILTFTSQMERTEGYYLPFNMQKARLRGLQAACEFAEAFQEIPLPVHGPFYKPSPTKQTVFP